MMTNRRTALPLCTLALTAGLLLAGSPEASARTSTAAELRGYQLCLDKARTKARGFMPHRGYLIQNTGQSREYFINAAAWVDGDRATVRVNCETSNSGRRLLSVLVAPGRYIQDTSVQTYELADN